MLHHAYDSYGYIDLQPVDNHVRDADHYGEEISHVSRCGCEKYKLYIGIRLNRGEIFRTKIFNLFLDIIRIGR